LAQDPNNLPKADGIQDAASVWHPPAERIDQPEGRWGNQNRNETIPSSSLNNDRNLRLRPVSRENISQQSQQRGNQNNDEIVPPSTLNDDYNEPLRPNSRERASQQSRRGGDHDQEETIPMSSLNDGHQQSTRPLSREPTSQQNQNPPSILRRPTAQNPYSNNNSQRDSSRSALVLTPDEHEIVTGRQQGSPRLPEQFRAAVSNVNGRRDEDSGQQRQSSQGNSRATEQDSGEGPRSQGLGEVLRRDVGNYTTALPRWQQPRP
jgi:hypothetical protein